MRSRSIRLGILPAILTLMAATTIEPSGSSTRGTKDPTGLIAHEWGTFTSIAGADGSAVDWMPQNGPSELPCFVKKVRINFKGFLWGTVRMETPVLYFYSPTPTTVSVKVRFRQGAVSEWYPQAEVTPGVIDPNAFARPNFESAIVWSDVKVVPGATENYPTETGRNHYYAARATDAVPLRVGSDQEKFLFYRGVGRFAPPVAATIDDSGRIDVRNIGGEPLGDLVLFENRDGVIGYTVLNGAGARAQLQGGASRGDRAALYRSLETILVKSGLYAKEAAAMVETWRDSWFEEGTRLLYIVPRTAVDAILPLDITPTPVQVARVFVGRLELVTADVRSEVKRAVLADDRMALKKYGRFFQPIVDRVRAESSPADLAAINLKLPAIYGSWGWPVAACQ